MPIYEYACRNCGHTLDALQKISDAPLVDCPQCEQPELKKRLSAPNFRLKGGGWYETDFKKDKQKNVLKSDSEAPKTDKDKKTDKATPDKQPDAKPKVKTEN